MSDEIQTVKTTETVQTINRPVPPPVPREPKTSMLSNILAIVGVIILIVIILWGLFHIANLGSPWLSSLFNTTPSTTIKVTAPARVISGDMFTVSWNYSTTEKGSYAFLYQCKGNIHILAEGPNGVMAALQCGAASTVSSGSNALKLQSILIGTTPTRNPVSAIFISRSTRTTQRQSSSPNTF